jgi:hypothetical protein
MIRFRCPGCSQALSVTDVLAAAVVACPRCRSKLHVPPAPASIQTKVAPTPKEEILEVIEEVEEVEEVLEVEKVEEVEEVLQIEEVGEDEEVLEVKEVRHGRDRPARRKMPRRPQPDPPYQEYHDPIEPFLNPTRIRGIATAIFGGCVVAGATLGIGYRGDPYGIGMIIGILSGGLLLIGGALQALRG